MLVDLANTNVFRGVYRPNPPIIGARLDDFIRSVAEKTKDLLGRRLTNLNIRLYDGWFDESGQGTELYEMVRKHLRESYPTRRRDYRLFVEIADTPLAARSHRLIHTFRQQAGLTRHHIGVMASAPTGCSEPRACSVFSLKSWVKGTCGVEGCAITTEEVAYFRQQKLVDTALVADTVWLGSQRLALLVVSDDEDVIPGLVTARAYGASVGWACQSARPREPYAGILASQGIGYVQC